MGTARAAAILREHAGAQWDERVVDALVHLVHETDRPTRATPLATIGRGLPDRAACVDAGPSELQPS